MLGSSSSSGCAAEAVHHPGCSSAGPRRKRLKTSHSLQRFANRFVDPWAFPAIQLDELTIEVVVQTRRTAKSEHSSSSASSSETIRPFKNEAQRPKSASSVAKVLPVSPTKLRPACVPPSEGLSQLKGKNLCKLLQPEEDFGQLETKEFYEAIAPIEKYFKKSSTIHESTTASKRKRDELDEENTSKVTCEVAAPTRSSKPTLCLNSNSQFEILGPNEINGNGFEVRGSSLPSISNVAANSLQLTEDAVICKTDQGDPSFPDLKLEATEPTSFMISKHQNVLQTTRSLATGVTKSMAMVVPTAKASQTVAAVRPQPSSQLVIMQNEPTSSVAQHLSLAQVPSVLDGMAPAQSWMPPTIVQAPPSYYVVDQSSPMQFYTHGPAMPHVVIEAPPPVIPAEVLQICNPINSSGFPVLQAGNNSPVLQPFTLMPASAALQQPVNNVSQAALPSGFWQAGPHNQLPRTSQSCSTRLSTSASPVSAPTHQRAACAGQRPRTILNLHAKTNASDACELNHQEGVGPSGEAQCSRYVKIVKQEISKCGMEEGSIDSSLPSRNTNVGLSPEQPFALQSTSSPLERFQTNSLESSSNDLLGIKNCSLSSASVDSKLLSSLSNENFLLVKNKGEFTSRRSCDFTDRVCHLVPNSCSSNWDIGLQSNIVGGEPSGLKPSLSNFNKPLKVKCHFPAEKNRESPVQSVYSTHETKLQKDVAKNGLNPSSCLGSSSCSFHKLDGLVSLSSLIYPKSKRNVNIMGISEFLRNDASITAFYTILNDWFTRICCSAFSHLATMCRTISISVLYDWQVSRGFTYGLKVPRLLPSLLRRKEKKSSLMALLCFRKVKNERLDHAVHFLEEKKDSVCNSYFPSELVASSKQSFKENENPCLVVNNKQVVRTFETPVEKTSSDQNPATNIDGQCGNEGVSSVPVQQVHDELVGPLDSENKFCKEAGKSVLETPPPRVDESFAKSTQLSDETTLTEFPSKSLCTFDTVSLFSNLFDVSFSSIAKSFESGILEVDGKELTSYNPHEEFLLKKTSGTSVTNNRSHFRWRSDDVEKFNNPVHPCGVTVSAINCDPTILPDSNTGVHHSSCDQNSTKPTFKEKEPCFVELNKTYQRAKKSKWGVGDLPAKTASDRARSVNSTLSPALSSLAGQKADQLVLNDNKGGFDQRLDVDAFNRKFNQKSTLKMLLSETKIENQVSSFKPNIHDSDLPSFSMASSDDCTSSFGRLTFDLKSEISSVELNTEANRSLSHQGWCRRFQSMDEDSGRMNINSDTEIDNVSAVSEVASSSSVDSDAGSFCNSREDEKDEEASSVVELPNDDDAYEELLKCGYEVSKPSLKFPSETRISAGSQISFKVYGKGKKAPCKKLPKLHKKKQLSVRKKKRDKKLKRMFKSRIARQTVDDIISARQPTEMPSHIIVSVQGKLFMYDDQVL